MLVITGAYGRKYKTLEDAKADWDSGKDFKIMKGPYCSIRDTELIKSMGHTVVIMAGENFELGEIIINGS